MEETKSQYHELHRLDNYVQIYAAKDVSDHLKDPDAKLVAELTNCLFERGAHAFLQVHARRSKSELEMIARVRFDEFDAVVHEVSRAAMDGRTILNSPYRSVQPIPLYVDPQPVPERIHRYQLSPTSMRLRIWSRPSRVNLTFERESGTSSGGF